MSDAATTDREVERLDALSRTRALDPVESRLLQALLRKQHLRRHSAEVNAAARDEGRIYPRNRGTAPPDADRVALAAREPRHRPLFDAIALGCAWQRRERPAGTSPAGSPISDAFATSFAKVSVTRPVGASGSGQSTTIDRGA